MFSNAKIMFDECSNMIAMYEHACYVQAFTMIGQKGAGNFKRRQTLSWPDKGGGK